MAAPHSWSFGICYDGNREFLDRAIASIQLQRIPQFEVLVATEHPIEISSDCVRLLVTGAEKANWITRKKNDMIRQARFNNVCLMHNYLRLDPNWYQAYANFQSDWRVCSNRILNPYHGNARVADWMCLDHPKFGVGLLPYHDLSQSPYMFLTGLYFLVKRDFIVANDLYLDEALVWGGTEDQEWSRRVRQVTHFSFNRNAVVYTLKDKRFEFLQEVCPPLSKRLRRFAGRIWHTMSNSHKC